MTPGIHPLVGEGVGLRMGGGFHVQGKSSIFTDNFDRANGALGANWAAGNDTALTIVSNQVQGTAAALRNSKRIGESYGNDHYSQISLGTGGIASTDFVGVCCRLQADGFTCYAAMIFLTGGEYAVQLYKRTAAGAYTYIDATPGNGSPQGYILSSAPAAGSTLRLNVAGNQLTVWWNGKRVLKATDATIPTGGVPGIIAFGADNIDNWQGANTSPESATPFQVYTSSPPNSANNGGGHNIQVLRPTSPNLAFAHNFLYVLPNTADGVFTSGDGMDTLAALGVHNDYNVTIIVPNFGNKPWYADTSAPGTFPSYMHETFMVNDLVPWVTANLATSGTEKHWLIAFSSSGWGGFDLLMRHPTVFAKGAFWDSPFGDSGATLAGEGMDASYGNAAYLDANYVQTSAFLDLYKASFTAQTRIWIGGYSAFQTQMNNMATLLTAKSMLFTSQLAITRQHNWGTGWPVDAMAALAAMP